MPGMDIDVSMRLKEARVAAHQDHHSIRRYLCGIWGYLRNRLRRYAISDNPNAVVIPCI